MKKIKSVLKINVIALMFLFSNQIIGASIISMEIKPLDQEKKFLLNIQSEGSGEIKIKLLDNNKSVIFSEATSIDKSFEKKFNLEGLETGDYSLIIEDELKIKIQPLELKEQELALDQSLEETWNKPQVSLNNEEDHFDVNWFMNQKGDFELSLEDDDSVLLFEKTIKNKRAIHSRFNISNLPSGSYHLTLKNENRTYYKMIRID